MSIETTSTAAEQVEDRGQEERAAAAGGAGLEHDLRSRFVKDLLVHPQIERALQRRDAHPFRIPGVSLRVGRFVKQPVKLLRALCDAVLTPALRRTVSRTILQLRNP